MSDDALNRLSVYSTTSREQAARGDSGWLRVD